MCHCIFNLDFIFKYTILKTIENKRIAKNAK